MANKLNKNNKVKKKWSKKKKVIITVVVITLIIGWVVIKNVQAKKQQEQNNIKVTSVESMTPVQKEAYELTNKFGQFYFLDKNITVDKVNSFKDIFSPEVQKEMKLDTTENVEKYVEKVKKINDETKFITVDNPKILTSNDKTVVLLVNLKFDVISSDNNKRKPGNYDATVMIAVENGKIAAFKLEGIKKVN